MGFIDDGPLRKVRRAERHRDEGHELLGAWLETDPIELVKEAEAEFGVQRWLMRRHSEPPPEVGLAFGDMVHNLRSALDHVVCGLVRKQNEEPTNWTAFPIDSSAERFWQKRANWKRDPLRFVEDEWADEVARWQPFANYLDTPGDDPLATLALLDNIDKHRNLLVTVGAVWGTHLGMTVKTTDATTLRFDHPRGIVTEDGEPALWAWTDPPAQIEVVLDPKPKFATEVVIDKAPVPLPGLIDPVREVVEAFRAAFG